MYLNRNTIHVDVVLLMRHENNTDCIYAAFIQVGTFGISVHIHQRPDRHTFVMVFNMLKIKAVTGRSLTTTARCQAVLPRLYTTFLMTLAHS